VGEGQNWLFTPPYRPNLPKTLGTDFAGTTTLDQHLQATEDDGCCRDNQRDDGEAATRVQAERQGGGDKNQWSSKEPHTRENTVNGSSPHSRRRRRHRVDEGVVNQESSKEKRTDFEQTQRYSGEGKFSFFPPAFSIVHPHPVLFRPMISPVVIDAHR
jgi:hypothetical protein